MKTKLSDNEYEIMDLIWNSDHPLSRSELLANRKMGANWQPKSINIIINNMLAKGVIRKADEEKTYNRAYIPVLTKEQYMAECVVNGTPGRSERDRFLSVVCGFVNRKKLSHKDIDDLKSYLEKINQEDKW